MQTKYTLDQEQVDAIKGVFGQFDTNGDGHIDKSEIGNMLEMLGRPVNDVEVEKMFNESDFDKDGKISFDEFLKVASQQLFNSSGAGGEDNEDLYNQLDFDHDGKIVEEEFVKFMTGQGKLDAAEAKERFKEVDTDNDGKISKDELTAFLNE
ncbi:EF-hand [Conidiobolus coronatus NRRL 28638]|uniref:EF-hand n=1 Tax=Conidiobolus coronatus (strain ATCC 28846 / CBS 209.66 / NRRL 28638) TaxID=796925 RepID=A0A137PB24_CONC2|nr:EF-hand [Conidiobolus coronatus NRRL 28638]|eukprot:KXN72195.1 EF-hand [Conidiobolus coronatus NRRL 28638]